MSRKATIDRLRRSIGAMLQTPRAGVSDVGGLAARVRGTDVARSWSDTQRTDQDLERDNPLHRYFDSVTNGPGIWKWLHYFEIYHRHLARFVDRAPSLVEIGVYSGGSLAMWQHYFGPGAHIHGVDIQPDCRVYASDHVTIHIGDQGDRAFWGEFRDTVEAVDILIDDGGHTPEQQMVTLEEMLPYLSPGGVYICEDVHGINNEFSAYVSSLANQLNAFHPSYDQRELSSPATPLQSDVHSIHLYPYVVVIEKRPGALSMLQAPKHGTEWQPFRTSVA